MNREKPISTLQLMAMFPDNGTAEKWFEEIRWPNNSYECPDCKSTKVDRYEKPRKGMRFRCRSCNGEFSAKKGTVMQSSKIGMQKWAYALYLMTRGIKGTSSIRVCQELGITQKSAWHMMHRLREGLKDMQIEMPFDGTVEVDESYIGGKQANKHYDQKIANAQGGRGKKMVIAVKKRESNQITAQVIENRTRESVQGFVRDNVDVDNSTIYTDDYRGYNGIPRTPVNHSVGQYVDGQAHVNGVESFWALLKRGIMGTFHHISPKGRRKNNCRFWCDQERGRMV